MNLPIQFDTIDIGLWTHFARSKFLTASDMYQRFLDICVHKSDSQVGYLHLFHPGRGELELTAWSSEVLSQCRTTHATHYPIDSAGIWADSIRQMKTVIHNDYEAEKSVQGLPEGHFPLKRHMSTPIVQKGEVIAILGVGNRAKPYDQADAENLEKMLSENWIELDSKLLNLVQTQRAKQEAFKAQDPQEILISIIGAISRTLELKDEYTTHHQSNVAMLCDKIAESIGMSEDQRIGLRIGAMIHDIGKIVVPSQILGKPGNLTPAELAVVRDHTNYGGKIFEGVKLPWPIRDMILQHHERMDGSGYPNGLVGQEIILEARIIAIADTFDAMASDRPYRKAPGKEAARQTLLDGRGTKFDTYLVDIFLEMLENEPEVEAEI